MEGMIPKWNDKKYVSKYTLLSLRFSFGDGLARKNPRSHDRRKPEHDGEVTEVWFDASFRVILATVLKESDNFFTYWEEEWFSLQKDSVVFILYSETQFPPKENKNQKLIKEYFRQKFIIN